MPGSKTMALTASGFSEISVSLEAPISDWLRLAVLETVRREPLLAAEDAIMLVDIVIALSRGTMTIEEVIAIPIIGGWLKKAAVDNLGRSVDDAVHDAVFLRDMLILNMFKYYRDGQLSGPDVDIRIYNILESLWGIGKDVVRQWSKTVSERIRTISCASDGGMSEIMNGIDLENSRNHPEMADIYEQMSFMTKDDLRSHLLMIAKSLSGLKNQLQ